MGQIQKEYLIIEIWGEDDPGIKKLDAYIKSLDEQFRELFFKNVTQTNGYVTYFYSWDGSKEGWEESNVGDKIRKTFIRLAISYCEYPSILHIITRGDNYTHDVIRRIR